MHRNSPMPFTLSWPCWSCRAWPVRCSRSIPRFPGLPRRCWDSRSAARWKATAACLPAHRPGRGGVSCVLRRTPRVRGIRQLPAGRGRLDRVPERHEIPAQPDVPAVDPGRELRHAWRASSSVAPAGRSGWPRCACSDRCPCSSSSRICGCMPPWAGSFRRGTTIPQMYPFWFAGLVLLYLPCRWYGEFKRRRPPNSLLRLL